MNLYFINSYDEKKLISNKANKKNAIKIITRYVKKVNPNYKIYYTRVWERNGETKYDIGSHTEFFVLGD